MFKAMRALLEGPGYFLFILTLVVLTMIGAYTSGLIGGILMPAIWLGTVFLCSQFIHEAFDLPKRSYAFRAMLSYLYNLKFAVLSVKEGKLPQKAKDKPMIKMGGPGIMKVAADTAVVTEKGGKPNVRGPGSHFLAPGEKIVEAVDLRQQVRSAKIEAMTRDGIPVKVNCSVGFHIARGNRNPTDEEPYPFSQRAVLWAVYNKSVTDAGPSPWHERVIAATQGAVRELIARYTLDELYDTPRRGTPPRPRLMEELRDSVQRMVRSRGVEVDFASFGTLEIPERVEQRYIEAWAARWQAEALQKTVSELSQVLRKHGKAGEDAVDEIVRIRALEALEAIAKEPATKIYFPFGDLKSGRPPLEREQD